MSTASNRIRVAAAVAALAVIGGAAAVATRDAEAVTASPGPTAAAQTRTLTTTLHESGAVERLEERTITHAAPATPEPGALPTTTTAPGAPANGAQQTSTTTAPAAPAQPAASASDADEETATLTALLSVGETVDRGTTLYTADDEPTVAVIGNIPLWRTLNTDAEDGADIRQLEENLVVLGHGNRITVDESFTAATAAAVEAWEEQLGRVEPDGTVEIGEVVFLNGPGDVLSRDATIGQALEPGDAVLTIGSQQQVVVASVDADEAGAWPTGLAVELTWADGSTSQATVASTSKNITEGAVDLVVGLGAADTDRPSGAEAAIEAENSRRADVVAVPVAAVVAAPNGKRAVRVPTGGTTTADRIVLVDTGVVADSWIEILSGIAAGTEVRLPG